MNEGGSPGDRPSGAGGSSMGSIDHLKRQHRELLHLVKEVAPYLQAERLVHDVTAVRLKLAAFVRKLGVHLALEDRFIYERLLRHSEKAVANQAAEHQREVHSLRARVGQYAKEWISIGRSEDDAPPKFIDDTKALFE